MPLQLPIQLAFCLVSMRPFATGTAPPLGQTLAKKHVVPFPSMLVETTQRLLDSGATLRRNEGKVVRSKLVPITA
jgi:hypothetical protein